MGEYHTIPSVKATELDHFSHHFLPTTSPDQIVESIRGRNLLKVSCEESAKHSDSNVPTRDQSVHARTCQVIKNNHISFDPKLHVFNVKGTTGVTRVVTLFPRQTCSCPSTGDCYHILAVKYSLGIYPSSKRSARLNLSQLRKNTRSKKDKSGGK